MLLDPDEISDALKSFADIENLTFSLQQRAENGVWSDEAEISGYMEELSTDQRASWSNVYQHPVDATLYCAQNDLLVPGCRLVMLTENGVSVTTDPYMVLAVNEPIRGLPRVEVPLWQMR